MGISCLVTLIRGQGKVLLSKKAKLRAKARAGTEVARTAHIRVGGLGWRGQVLAGKFSILSRNSELRLFNEIS